MNVMHILGYFLAEAVVNLWRSWKVSLLAILTIGMSIFIGGTFLLLSGNLSRVVDNWRQEARIIVYLQEESTPADLERVQTLAKGAAWVISVDEVTGGEASSRFRATFPSVEDLLNSWEDEPLPASLELGFAAENVEEVQFRTWLESLRQDPAVLMVDDDRDWLRQLDAFVTILQSLGLVVGTALLGAAVVTIGSVIRLTAFLYKDEIAVLRLVGATELYIRGPFFFEGLIQGFAGGLIALLGLYMAFLALNPGSYTLLLGTVLVDRFLPWPTMLGLLCLASLAGCLGALLSLRRESLAAE